jgi:hypothetical protein
MPKHPRNQKRCQASGYAEKSPVDRVASCARPEAHYDAAEDPEKRHEPDNAKLRQDLQEIIVGILARNPNHM